METLWSALEAGLAWLPWLGFLGYRGAGTDSGGDISWVGPNTNSDPVSDIGLCMVGEIQITIQQVIFKLYGACG